MIEWVALTGSMLSGLVVWRVRSSLSPRGVRVAWAVWAVASIAVLVAGAGWYEVRKTVALCLMPLGLLWLGTAFGAVWFRRRSRRGSLALVVLWCALTLIGNVPLGTIAVGLLERPFRGLDRNESGPLDAVLVLGGGVAVSRDGRPQLSEVGQRLLTGAELVRNGGTEVLVASGPVVCNGGKTINYAEMTASLWEQMRVNRRHIVLQEGPRTTSEETAAFADLVERRGWSRVGVVTSAWHLPRVLHECRREGIDPIPLPAGFLARGRRPGLRAVVPQAEGVSRLQRFSWEVLGMTWSR